MAAYNPVRQGADAPELAAAFGDMLLAWQFAELEQISAFAAIIDAPHYKASRLYQKLPNFRSRTHAILMLLDLHPEFEAIRPYIRKLSRLSLTRNRWVHGMIIKRFHGTELLAIDLDEPLESDSRSKPIKGADVKNHANAVRATAQALATTLTSLPAYRAWSDRLLQKQRDEKA